MNESDPIVDEVRRIRDAHAAKFHYDPEAIFRDIKEQERRSGRTYVSFADESIAPKKAPQPTGPAPVVSGNAPSQELGQAAGR